MQIWRGHHIWLMNISASDKEVRWCHHRQVLLLAQTLLLLTIYNKFTQSHQYIDNMITGLNELRFLTICFDAPKHHLIMQWNVIILSIFYYYHHWFLTLIYLGLWIIYNSMIYDHYWLLIDILNIPNLKYSKVRNYNYNHNK